LYSKSSAKVNDLLYMNSNVFWMFKVLSIYFTLTDSDAII